jgi:predicted branched-subunit amino acid permease
VVVVQSRTIERSSLRLGARTGLPLAVSVVPFGVVYGVAASDTVVSHWWSIAASWIILAGTSQLSLLSAIGDGGPWAVGIGTALVINARFVLYSIALAPSFSEFPPRWRFGLPYLMTDQAASMALVQFATDDDPRRRRWWYLGAAGTFAIGWWIGTLAGALIGSSLPEQVDIGFAVPATFIALLMPTLTSRPAVIAATAGGAGTVAASGLPNGLNIIAGALIGMAAGRLVSARRAVA